MPTEAARKIEEGFRNRDPKLMALLASLSVEEVKQRDSYIQSMGHRQTSFGVAEYIKIRRQDGKPMTWREVWETFSDSYPEKWAMEFFPPRDQLLDEANIYHLYVLDEAPQGVNIRR